MNWYQGSITDAVALSRKNNAVFVVYVVGKNAEESQTIEDFMRDSKTEEKMQGDEFVAVQIEGDSESYEQFANIYKTVPQPSIFFIGRSGAPIEIATATDSKEILQRKLQNAFDYVHSRRRGAELIKSLTSSTAISPTNSNNSETGAVVVKSCNSIINLVNNSKTKLEKSEDNRNESKTVEANQEDENPNEEISIQRPLSEENLSNDMRNEEQLVEENLSDEKLNEESRNEENLNEENYNQAILKEEKLQEEELHQARLNEEELNEEELNEQELNEEELNEENLNEENRLQEKLQQEKLQQETLKQETLKQETLKQEKLQKEKLQQEALRQETLRQEKLLQETLRQEKLLQETIRQETLRQEKLKQEKLQQEKLQQEKLQQEKLQQEKLQQEKIQQEKLQQEKLQQEKLQQEKLQQEKLQLEKIQQEKLNQEKLNQEKINQEKINQEKINQEKINQEKINQENNEKELLEEATTSDANSLESLSVLDEKRVKDEKLLREEIRATREKRVKEEIEKIKNEIEKEIKKREKGYKADSEDEREKVRELKHVREAIKRDRLAKSSERQLILEKFANDRAEQRKQLLELSTPSNATCASAIVSDEIPSNESHLTKIQFRLADAKTQTEKFPSSTKFDDIRRHVQNVILRDTNVKNFSLSRNYPRKEFAPSDNSLTLIQLDLHPSAIIFIIPIITPLSIGTITPSYNVPVNIFNRFLWNLLAPILGIVHYLHKILKTPENNESPDSSAKSSTSSNNTGPVQQICNFTPKINDGASTSNYTPNQDSNIFPNPGKKLFRPSLVIHRLRDHKDSDDDNNTWNGNSTQQQ